MARNELRHWGIRGMKWGVRKSRSSGDGSSTSSGSHPSNAQPKQNSSRQQRYQKVMNKANKTPYRNVNKRESRFSFKNVAAGLAVGAASVAIASLIRPTINVVGQNISKKVHNPDNIFRYASKNLTKGVETFAN